MSFTYEMFTHSKNPYGSSSMKEVKFSVLKKSLCCQPEHDLSVVTLRSHIFSNVC